MDIDIAFELNDHPAVLPPDAGFHYVDQGNYRRFELVQGQPFTCYSDSATSCIIVAVVASHGLEQAVTLAHLDSPACITTFFDVIAGQAADQYQVFAQGANPADNDTSQQNAAQLQRCIAQLGAKVVRSQLSLLQGDPREGNRGMFGLSYDGATHAVAGNQPYTLQLFQRDPSCGGQTVYCIMRRQEVPPQQIRDAAMPFTHQELVELASIALQFRKSASDPATAFTNIACLESNEIRQGWSTTPAYEAPWFSDQLRLGAAFAIAMAPVVSLSEQHLRDTTAPSFARLRTALLAR